MKLSELLESGLIFPQVACSSKDDLIYKLVERVYDAKKPFPLPVKDLLDTVLMREKIGGTLLPSGLAIPHARLKDFEAFILAAGIPAEPLFHEGLRIRMAALMITSQSGGAYYLGTLAALTKISRDGEYFPRLYGAETPEQFISVVKERDPELD